MRAIEPKDEEQEAAQSHLPVYFVHRIQCFEILRKRVHKFRSADNSTLDRWP